MLCILYSHNLEFSTLELETFTGDNVAQQHLKIQSHVLAYDLKYILFYLTWFQWRKQDYFDDQTESANESNMRNIWVVIAAKCFKNYCEVRELKKLFSLRSDSNHDNNIVDQFTRVKISHGKFSTGFLSKNLFLKKHVILPMTEQCV